MELGLFISLGLGRLDDCIRFMHPLQFPTCARTRTKNERNIWSSIILQRYNCHTRVCLGISHQELEVQFFRLHIKSSALSRSLLPREARGAAAAALPSYRIRLFWQLLWRSPSINEGFRREEKRQNIVHQRSLRGGGWDYESVQPPSSIRLVHNTTTDKISPIWYRCRRGACLL